jgi:hypothetical protein
VLESDRQTFALLSRPGHGAATARADRGRVESQLHHHGLDATASIYNHQLHAKTSLQQSDGQNSGNSWPHFDSTLTALTAGIAFLASHPPHRTSKHPQLHSSTHPNNRVTPETLRQLSKALLRPLHQHFPTRQSARQRSI